MIWLKKCSLGIKQQSNLMGIFFSIEVFVLNLQNNTFVCTFVKDLTENKKNIISQNLTLITSVNPENMYIYTVQKY
jgi:hypothetical protein